MKFRNRRFKLSTAAFLILAASFLFPARSRAQGLELSGGYAHATSDFGTDGFDLGAAYYFAPRLSIAAEYDGMWDTSRVGSFEFTSVGAIVSQAHLQNFLVGPRFYFSDYKVGKSHFIKPFGEVQFGVSHLRSRVQEGTTPSTFNSDSAFSWMLGGGVDYPITPHWTARGNLDLLRTHLNANAQSRARLVLGIAYTWGER
jgi:opacity protein-like surface antigen